jgi:hypothetical protein
MAVCYTRCASIVQRWATSFASAVVHEVSRYEVGQPKDLSLSVQSVAVLA